MNLDNSVEQPDLLDAEFSALRERLLSDVHPVGPDAVRYTVRRRRQRTAVVMSVVAVAALALPVAGYGLLMDREAPPTGNVVPPPSLAPTSSVSPTVSSTPTGTPVAKDGRLTREELLGTAFDLPDWPQSASSVCGGSAVRLRSGPVNEEVPALLDLAHGDVDSDGTVETLARLECRSSIDWPRQIVAFDRDTTGRIVVLGQVTRTGPGAADLREFRVEGGAVRVRVADQCCGANPAQTQWRSYSWSDGRFRQTAGPTNFPSTTKGTPTTAPPARTVGRLTLTATDLVYGAANEDGVRRAASTVTIVNPTDATVGFPAITFVDNGKDTAEHAIWSGCPTAYGYPDRMVCITRPLGPGERRSIAFGFLTTDTGPARTVTVRADIAAEHDTKVLLPNSGNQTTIQAVAGS